MTDRACRSCGTANEADARFCEGCGTALDRRCSGCGTQASATARFCRSCGGSLDGPAEPAHESPTRKTVTVLFADLAGSTTFEEKVDAETAREVLGHYHTLLRETAERHRAGTVKYIGDGFMAVWGVPEISAADADHAVDAAVELQQRFVGLADRVAQAHAEDLALRVAVNTGEVVVGAGDADLVGDALNVAARLESECPHGHVVVGEETWRSTRGRHRYEPLSRVQVKGRTAPVAVYQWAGRRSEPADSVPFVGRSHEIRRLHAVLDDAVARRAARLVTVVGDPGVGKTRLAAEFAASHKDAEILHIRCAAEGTVALAPVVEALRPRDLDSDLAATVPERDRILRDLNGMIGGVAGSVEETFWGLRRYFEVLAERGKLILVLDDIQWADALLLDFVEHLSEWVREAPILMVALARPELRETRPELVTVGGWVGDAIRLGGLEPGATAELATRVLGSGQLPTELLARLPSSTGGNPLFVRELVAMLVHDGVLVAEAQGWRLTIDVDAIAVPPTIQALLASRLERMNTADRRVLETASVIGADFSAAAVCALNGASAAETQASLDRLRRMELAQHSGAYTGDDPVWRFHHILIRDVAYRRLLKSERAELHERFADWIQTGGQTGLFESDELVARHLESAHGYRSELGARDSHTADLALRSARCYLSAARRALDRDALVSAGAQAARGAALASADAALQAELLLVGCEAYLSAGDVAAGAPLVDELDRVADDALAPWATCYRCQYLVYTDPSRLPEVEERLQEAIDEFARRGDPGGSAKAYRVRASVRGRLGRIGDCEADLFEALIAARHGGDHRQITAALGAAPNAALWGPSPAPKAGGRCLDVVRMQRMTTAAPSLEATSLRCLAVLELLRGRPDKARSMLADARAIVSELGLRHGLMETELFAGIIESMVGDPVAAEPHFRTALEGLDSLGVGADAGQAAALLARSLLAQGRIDEADGYAAESERIAGHNIKTAIGWRAVRAEILSAQGRHDEAVAMARDAVDVAADTDLVLDYADACLTLSRVLADSGDGHGAAEARREAESLYAAKDAVFLVGVSSPRADPPAAAAPPAERAGRLNVVNRACDIVLAGWHSLQLEYTEGFVYDDHRKVSGDPLRAPGDFLAAALRKQEQFPHMEATVLAVRGQTLALIALRWWDDAGNETMSIDLYEIDESDSLGYHGRFDEDDYVGAYRTLEKRYYAGGGAPFAANGLKVLAFEEAFFAQDVEAARETVHPDFRWCAAASALKPGERSLEELFAWRAERLTQVVSFWDGLAALRWLSPDVCVSRCEIRATGHDGEEFRWNRFYVTEYRDGLSASVREFDIANEDEAFAYAESLVARDRSRLVVRNRASEVAGGLIAALLAKDGSAAAAFYAERLIYDDRRRIRGNPMTCREDLRNAAQKAIQQYGRFENQTLAVRGERIALVSSRWSDPAGNETSHLHVFELDDQGLIIYEGRFDDDDLTGAYRVLEERYYQGEGAAFAANGLTQLEFQTSVWAQDVEAARPSVQVDFRWCAEPSTLKPGERSLDGLFAWRAERLRQVASFQDWLAALRWLSPECCISFCVMRGTGHDGEEFRWNRFYVTEYRDGLMASGREFDAEDEDAAFGYAESLVARSRRRLAVRNRISGVVEEGWRAVQAHDVDPVLALYSDGVVYDDQRGISGGRLDRAGLRTALMQLIAHYPHVQWRPLAVRGETLELVRGQWSDDAGNEATYFDLYEFGDDDLIEYHGRFDDDDFLSAYTELERRYYDGEGADFAEGGRVVAGWVEGIGRRDIEMVRRFSTPDFRWFASESSLKAPERTVEDMFEWMGQRGQQVSSQRHWESVIHWVSPACAVGLVDISAVGHDGEEYLWNSVVVAQLRDGLVASVREFDTEDDAFAHAENVVASQPNRLAVANLASAVGHRLVAAMNARDIDAAARTISDQVVADDRRRLSGVPVTGQGSIPAAFDRVARQYSRFDLQTLAVRGERLHLAKYRWSDSSGNETSGLALAEVGPDGLIVYDGRFDEDDFGSAYVELEHRYHAGEGVAFAEAGAALSQVLRAESRGDLDSAFSMFMVPGLRIESRSHSIFPSRTAEELRQGLEELGALVESYRVWSPVVCWLSPEWVVARHEREAVGRDGESFTWSRLYVSQVRHGVFQSVCEFDADNEEQAFAYAEERMRATASRLAVANRASAVGELLADAIRHDGDLDRALAQFAEDCAYEDCRRLSGGPIIGLTARRAALERIVRQFPRLDMVPLAVRGDHLVLERCCRSDDAGNESTVLVLGEIDDDDRLICYISFDEDDFENAYLELERRYHAGEGSAFAGAGTKLTNFVTALNRGGLDAAFSLLDNPDLRIQTRSRSVFPERTTAELREDLGGLVSMVSSVRWWYSALCWLSPSCCVGRQEREATGPDGERYAWTDIYAAEFRGDVPTWVCRFNIGDEAQAFADAQERMVLHSSRLAVSNRATEVRLKILAAMQRGDFDAAAGAYADQLVYDDHRRLSGEPFDGRGGIRAALSRLRSHYSHFKGELLAVRGDRLVLGSYQCSDDSGNQMAGLLLIEINPDGLTCYEGRFDEDDFESAYYELDRRYYSGEGAPFADYGMTMADYFAARNRGDLDTVFNSLSSPDLRVESRSRSVFAVRSAAEHRASIEELTGLVGSVRDWISAIQPISPTWGVSRYQRRAAGRDGGDYHWERIVVAEVRERRLTFVCDFAVDDEDAAFAYAEERARASASRLPLTNRAAEVIVGGFEALRKCDVEAVADNYREDCRFDDRRRLGGDSIEGRPARRAAVDRILHQFSRFEWRTLAVRGCRLVMGWSRWSDDGGNESDYLHVAEIDEAGRIVYDGRFDEDDFDSAYHELDRRFYIGEGAVVADNEWLQTAFMDAVNRLDVEAAQQMCLPTFRLVSPPTTLATEERSLKEFFSWVAERAGQSPSVRHWMSVDRWVSANCLVSRLEIQSIGPDGDEYTWPRIAVSEVCGGFMAGIRQFDVDDEDAAFDYAEIVVAKHARRLPSTNIASEVAEAGNRAMNAGDIDALADLYAEKYVFDDCRRLSGDPLQGRAAIRSAAERLLGQFSNFEARVLAVRRERLSLGWSRWSDDAGNQTAHLHVIETGDNGRIVYDGRFDEDDFEGAYAELERRYYAGEGAAFADNGLVTVNYVTVMNRGDFDTVVNELTRADFRLENRSRSPFPDRSAADLRRSFDDLYALVPAIRAWFPAITWVSPETAVMRMEREAVGRDGQPYSWSRILVSTWKDGQLASLCDFNPDDEDAAFAYAETIVE